MQTQTTATVNNTNANVPVGANDNVYAANETVGLNDSKLVKAGTVSIETGNTAANDATIPSTETKAVAAKLIMS